MKLSNLKKLYLYIFFTIPFLISLFFYYYSVNNKKFEIEYTLNVNEEIIFIDSMLRENSDLSILKRLEYFIEKYKYSNKIRNIELLRNEKKLILKQLRLIGEDTPFTIIKFNIFGVNYDESIFEEYILDILSICMKSLSSQLEYEKNLLINKKQDIVKILDDYNKNVQKLPPEKYISIHLNAKSINLLEKVKNIITSKEKNFLEIEARNLIVKSNMHFVILSIILYFITSIIILFILKFYSILSKNILSIKKKTRKIKSNII